MTLGPFSNVMVPGNSVSIARQFIRCVLHQLAPNGIFPILFQSNFEGKSLLKGDPHTKLFIDKCKFVSMRP